jgi:hypothetical protein
MMEPVNKMNSKKTIIRVRKEDNFVIISRFPLEDKRLSWEARGLYSFLLAKPDNWTISLTNLTNSSPCGYDKTKRILNELIKFKYIHKEVHRDENGQFTSPDYTRYEHPFDGYFSTKENPSAVKSAKEEPPTLDPELINIHSNKETKIITTTTTSPCLEWPKGLEVAEQISIKKFVGEIPEEDAQILLDELGGQLKNIANPVGYFHSLFKKYRDDLFVPAVALKYRSDREKRVANIQAIERSHAIAEKRLIERMEKQGLKSK